MNSVCLALYNGEKYIADQLKSILSQLGDEDEVIVSDDGSADRSLDIVGSFGDPRIRVVRNRGERGVNSNFNNALRNARGEYVFLSDQDNVWLPGKVEACLEALAGCDLVVHDARITDSRLQPLPVTLFEVLHKKEGFLNNLFRNRFSGCCMAIRREMLRKALPVPADNAFFYDSWLGMVSALRGKTAFIPFVGTYMRRHEGSMSTVGSPSVRSMTARIGGRVKLLKELINRNIIFERAK